MTVATSALFTGGFQAPTPGTWTPDGTPATIDAGTGWKGFPGLARLDAARVLLVYRSGTNHASGGSIVGRIGTLSGTSVSWAGEFTIRSDATYDVRCDDAVSIADGRVCITGRLYTGSASIDPFILVSDDLRAYVDSSTTWTEHAVAFAEGSDYNIPGRLIELAGTYVLPGYWGTSGTTRAGVLLNASLTDWSSPTWVEVTGDGYTEISVERLWGEYLLALIRTESGTSTSKATSSDGGATWSSITSAHDGYGFPTLRRMSDSVLLTAYRDAPDGETMWRSSSDGGASWSSESLLDDVQDRSTYAALLQLDFDNALCVYAAEDSGQTDSDLYSQIFSRS